jgi:hypothetical protein
MYGKIISVLMIGLLLFLSGCGSKVTKTRSFMRENTSLAHIQKIAILPFEGSGNASRVREFTMTQVLAAGMFDVVDKGLVDSFMQQEALAPGAPMDIPTMRRLGQIVGVQAFLLGSVEQITETRGNASFAEITMTLRLLDTETGTLLWQASGLGSGYSLPDRLFGFAPKDTFDVTMALLARLLATLR